MDTEEPRDEDRLLRVTIVVFSGALLVLIVLSIMLSLLSVPSATLIYGSEHVWRGQQAGFRAIAVHPIAFAPWHLKPSRFSSSTRPPSTTKKHEPTTS